MSKCEQCIVRQFSSLKALNKDELLRLADCKTSHTIKKGEIIFEEGEITNGIYCIKKVFAKFLNLATTEKIKL
jgi:hypothetical protein